MTYKKLRVLGTLDAVERSEMKETDRKKLIQEYYSIRADDYDKQKSRTWKSESGFGAEVIEAVIAAVADLENRLVLEIGVGSGRIGFPLLEKVKPWLIGLDLSKEMLKRAKAKLSSFKHRFDLVLGDAERLPFREDVFDALICLSTMHYFADSEKSLANFSRILQNKGVFVYGDLTLHELDDRGFLELLEKTLSKAHAKYYKTSEMRKMLEHHRFNVFKTKIVPYRKSYSALMEDKGKYFHVKPEALRKIIHEASSRERELYGLGDNELTLFYTLITALKES